MGSQIQKRLTARSFVGESKLYKLGTPYSIEKMGLVSEFPSTGGVHDSGGVVIIHYSLCFSLFLLPSRLGRHPALHGVYVASAPRGTFHGGEYCTFGNAFYRAGHSRSKTPRYLIEVFDIMYVRG